MLDNNTFLILSIAAAFCLACLGIAGAAMWIVVRQSVRREEWVRDRITQMQLDAQLDREKSSPTVQHPTGAPVFSKTPQQLVDEIKARIDRSTPDSPPVAPVASQPNARPLPPDIDMTNGLFGFAASSRGNHNAN